MQFPQTKRKEEEKLVPASSLTEILSDTISAYNRESNLKKRQLFGLNAINWSLKVLQGKKVVIDLETLKKRDEMLFQISISSNVFQSELVERKLVETDKLISDVLTSLGLSLASIGYLSEKKARVIGQHPDELYTKRIDESRWKRREEKDVEE